MATLQTRLLQGAFGRLNPMKRNGCIPGPRHWKLLLLAGFLSFVVSMAVRPLLRRGETHSASARDTVEDELLTDQRSVSLETVVQRGHNILVKEMRFNADSTLLASEDVGGRVQIWETRSGRLLAAWNLEPEHGQLAGFDAEDNVITMGQGRQRHFDLRTGYEVASSSPPWAAQEADAQLCTGGQKAVTFEPGGRLPLPFGRTLTRLRVNTWYVDDGSLACRHAFSGLHKWQGAMSPGGEFALLYREEGGCFHYRVRCMNPGARTHAGRIELPLRRADPDPSAIALSPNGRFVALPVRRGEESGFGVFRTRDGGLERWLEDELVYNPRCAFGPKGRYLVIWDDVYGFTSVWRTRDWAQVIRSADGRFARLSPDASLIAAVPANPGGMRVRYIGYRMRLCEPDTQSWRVLHPEASWIWNMALSTDGRYLGVIERTRDGSGRESREVMRLTCYDLQEGELVWRHGGRFSQTGQESFKGGAERPWFSEVAVSADGSALASRTREGRVYVWSMPDGRLLQTVQASRTCGGVALSADGRVVAVADTACREWREDLQAFWGAPDCVSLYEVSTGDLVETLRLFSGDGVEGLVFSPDDRYLFIGSVQRTAEETGSGPGPTVLRRVTGRVWDLRKRETVSSFVLPDLEQPWPCGFSRNGRQLFIGGYVLRVADGEIEEQPLGLWILSNALLRGDFWINGWNHSVSLSPGVWVRSAPDHAAVVIWGYPSGGMRATLYGFPRGCVFVTPNGFYRGTGELDRYVHFVEGREIRTSEDLHRIFHRPDKVRAALGGTAGADP